MLLVPCHPLRATRPDDHFAADVDAARELGVPVALFDHDRPHLGLTRPRSGGPAEAVLRSWMLSADGYTALEQALAGSGVRLRTNADAYRAAHHLPGWYASFEPLTPASAWVDGPDVDALVAASAELPAGPAVLKDFVKSLKHRWEEACYVPHAHDGETVREVASRFVELRDVDFAGGLVLRSFEPFTGAEARSWWVNGRCAAVTAHPDTPEEIPAGVPVDAAAEAVAALGCGFVTVDWAHRADGAWRVVEVGDGQVSDRPAGFAAAELIGALFGQASRSASSSAP